MIAKSLILLALCANSFGVYKATLTVNSAAEQSPIKTNPFEIGGNTLGQQKPHNKTAEHHHTGPNDQMPDATPLSINSHEHRVEISPTKIPHMTSSKPNSQDTTETKVSHTSLSKEHMQQKVEQITQQAHQHIPQVIKLVVALQGAGKVQTGTKEAGSQQTHTTDKQEKQRTKRAVVPSHIQHTLQQMHQYVPHAILSQQNKHRNHAGAVHDPEPPKKCNFACTPLDLSVCATNGKCWKEFESLCELSSWNCLHTDKTFTQVFDAQCMDSAKASCYPGDM